MSQTPQVESGDAQIRLQAIESLSKIGGNVAIAKLVLMLVDPDESVRVAAKAALNKQNPQWAQSDAAKRAIPALEIAANDDNYWVALEATTVLKVVKGEVVETAPAPEDEGVKESKTVITDRFFHQKREAGRILAAALKDSDADFRLASAETLGRLGNVGFAEPLSSVLNDPDEWVRWHAAHSLLAIGWEPPDEKLKALYLVTLRRWDEAEKLGPAIVDPLLTALKSSNSKVREVSATILGKFKEAQAVLPLLEALQDKQKPVRRAAAKALSSINPKNLSMEQRNLMMSELRV